MDWVSSSPVFHAGRNSLGKNFADHPFEGTLSTSIGNDVWIGTDCLVKAGVKIGDGAVIGMGSVLTKDVDNYEVWAGNPASMIGRRFDLETSSALANTKWWGYDETELEASSALFTDVAGFLRHARSRAI
jgi:acetyltransferase-like isoleucine patch superfamily enzyme